MLPLEPPLLMTANEASIAAGPTHMSAGREIDVRKDGETRRKAYYWAAQKLLESPPRGHSRPEPGTASVDDASRIAGLAHIPAGPEIEDGKDEETKRNPYNLAAKRLWESPPYGRSRLEPGTAFVD